MAKRALLIGVNQYQIPGSDLRGCVNDVESMRSTLQTMFGFADRDIATLVDAAATGKAIQKAITSLVKGARKGDVLLLHYSGHGSNVPDKDGDEADRRDEIMCPTDLDWKKPLTDDWLRKAFNGLRTGVNLTVVMDCCHSGTITRAINPPDAPIIERYLPSPWDLVAVESGRALRGTVRNGHTPARTRKAAKRSDVVAADIGEMLITGYRATQTSADAYMGGTYNGALTYCLVETLKATRGQLSYRELHAGTLARLKREGMSQVPQLEGRTPGFERAFLAPIA